MKSVKVHIVLFVSKLDPEDTFSVVGDEDVKSDSFEGTIFGEHYCCSGLYKAMSHAKSLGHTVIESKHDVTVNIPTQENPVP